MVATVSAHNLCAADEKVTANNPAAEDIFSEGPRRGGGNPSVEPTSRWMEIKANGGMRRRACAGVGDCRRDTTESRQGRAKPK